MLFSEYLKECVDDQYVLNHIDILLSDGYRKI